MEIRAIVFEDRRDVANFVQVPFEIYRDCKFWTPPLIASVRIALNRRRHPFYSHSDAAFFLAEQDGAVVGRIAVLENCHYNNHNKSRAAFFYYFDVVDDLEVVNALIAAARGWAREHGLTCLMGPKGMLRADAYGILVEGFDRRAGMGIPYNYPYYAPLLEAIGFKKEIDYVSGYATAKQQIPDRLFQLVERIKTRRSFWVKSFTSKGELRAWIPRIQQVNNEAFTEVWGYYPIDEAEVQMIGKQLLTVSDPRLLKVVMKGEDIAGFAFVFPDVATTLRAIQGRLWPFGWLRLLIAAGRTRHLLGNGIGLLPQYQGLGASAMLYAALHDTIRRRGADHLEIVQVMETNLKSLGDMNMLGINWHKRHRVYRLEI